MIIVPGPASPELGKKIAHELGVEAFPVDHRIFPDGESYVRFTRSLKGEHVVIVQTTSPPQDTRLIQLYQMVATAKELGAKGITCCVPYLAYSRQDKRFLEGEAVSLEIVVHLLAASGADELITIDAHSGESLKRAGRAIGVRDLSAIPLLAQRLKELGYGGAYSLGPDRGALHLAEKAGRVLGGGFGFFEKQRDRRTGEIKMVVKDVDVEGRDAVVFDDIVSSGGTMALAIAELKNQGAKRVAAACTHALFMAGAEKRIQDSGAELIIATDTVETKFSSVTIAPLVAQFLKTTS